jgi:hypothetical protein
MRRSSLLLFPFLSVLILSFRFPGSSPQYRLYLDPLPNPKRFKEQIQLALEHSEESECVTFRQNDTFDGDTRRRLSSS